MVLVTYHLHVSSPQVQKKLCKIPKFISKLTQPIWLFHCIVHASEFL